MGTALEESGTVEVTQRLPNSTRPHLFASDAGKAPSMAPRSTRPATGANRLVHDMTLDGEQPTNDKGERKPHVTSISYFPDGKQMVGGSTDNSARRWDLQTGEEIVEARVACEQAVWAVAVSRDSRWIITGGGDQDSDDHGELKACEVETGMMKTFKGHSRIVTCVDVSVDNKLLASGSFDHTARIWDLNTGELVAGPFECVDSSCVGAVRFSEDTKKLAVKSGAERCLEVWDIQEQKLDGRVGKGGGRVLPDTPVFWTAKDRSIVAAFSFKGDFEDPRTIYEFNSSTLETVGAPFEGHTGEITGLALSFDYHHLLASASHYDNTIKLWAFESRQLLASFHVHNIHTLILSPYSRQLAYTTFHRSSIHIYYIPLSTIAPLDSSVHRPDSSVHSQDIEFCSAFNRLSVVKLPEYRKVNDTRRSSPAVSQGAADNDPPHDSSDNDSLPDVHWCKAFFCYYSCWSRGALRMPPRWRLERVESVDSD